MSKKTTIKDAPALLREALQEARSEGYHAALYAHHPIFHTLDTRQKMLNHQHIKEAVRDELLAFFKESL